LFFSVAAKFLATEREPQTCQLGLYIEIYAESYIAQFICRFLHTKLYRTPRLETQQSQGRRYLRTTFCFPFHGHQQFRRLKQIEVTRTKVVPFHEE